MHGILKLHYQSFCTLDPQNPLVEFLHTPSPEPCSLYDTKEYRCARDPQKLCQWSFRAREPPKLRPRNTRAHDIRKLHWIVNILRTGSSDTPQVYGVRRNSISGFFEDPVRWNSANGVIEDPIYAENNPMFYTGNGVLAAVHKTSGSGVFEDPFRNHSTTRCFVDGSQMIH